MFAVCLDIGGFCAGAMVRAMNMASHSVGSGLTGIRIPRGTHRQQLQCGVPPTAALLLLGPALVPESTPLNESDPRHGSHKPGSVAC